MDSGVSQLFWIVIIITVFAASVVKRFLVNKSKTNAKNNIREQDGVGESKPARQQTTSEWENFLGDMFGVKPVREPNNRPGIERRPKANHIEAKEKKQTAHENVVGEEHGITEFHTTIEDRHLKSSIEVDAAKKSLFESDIFGPLSTSWEEYALRTKKRSEILNNMFKKGGLKDAIIYSEIIGPPVGLRKRSLFWYKHQ
ncbi:MAG: hypothetical protein ACUZ8H_14745 [Candidatus Anammoxibacter sp.]